MIHDQIAFLRIGREGCYFLSILRLAEMITGEKAEALAAYHLCVSQGWMRPNCFVQNPDKILSYFTAQDWSVRHEPVSYFPTVNEKEILRWENDKTPMQTLGHFVVGNGFGVALWDPSGVLSHDWKLISKRIFRRKE